MIQKILNGDQAMAWGALSSGVKIITSYPGSPSSGTMNVLIDLADEHDLYIEWSTNEKVAIELATGASMAGRRTLVCVKSVGMNVIVDPLMVLNLTPLNGGMVILMGDDPGAYGSQNDQDTRPVAPLVELPMLEPASPTEAYTMMREAFVLSEKYQVPFIIRETRSFTNQEETLSIDNIEKPVDRGLAREPYRFTPVPINAVAKHKALHETLDELTRWADTTPYNRIEGTGEKGVIASGFGYQKVKDVLGPEIPESIRILKLGNLYPLPRKTITEFINHCDEVLVIEENSPFIESQIKALAQEEGMSVSILGKGKGLLPQAGEIFRWQIQRAFTEYIPDSKPTANYSQDNEADEIPQKKSFCGDCRYNEVLDHLDRAAKTVGQKPVIIGDPGCIVTVADRIDAKYAMGSAVAVADGVSKAGCNERAVAIFGDSSFFHTTIPAICNAVQNESDILLVVLDNKATRTSGFQPNPGVGKNALGREAPVLDIEQIVRACGISKILKSNLDDTNPSLADVFATALQSRELTFLTIRIE